MIDEQRLRDFIRESNRIEGIEREPTQREILLVQVVLGEEEITVTLLDNAVNVFEPGAKLRDKTGMDVRVGNHIAPPGGPDIRTRLAGLVGSANTLKEPYGVHCAFERLHAFTDGNGRSGRLLWLWMMFRRDGVMPPLGFLHQFYYQTLAASHD